MRQTGTDQALSSLLEAVRVGDRQAFEELYVVLYDDLRKLARRFIGRERPGHTLQPTALVNEAYVRLAPHAAAPCSGRAHFLALAGLAMRRILIDHAKKKRHAGGRVSFPEDLPGGPSPDIAVLDLEDIIRDLEASHARLAQVVVLRFYGGLTVEDVSLALGVDERTVHRDWAAARAIIRRRLEGRGGKP